ncbi:MAG TPA: hypothetical protein VGI30_04600 [Caulobacteraceae bacterium]
MQPIAWMIATLDAAMILIVVVMMVWEDIRDPGKPRRRRPRTPAA